MIYFNNCSNVNEVKAEYKKLVRQHHPDVSGYDSTAVMQAINKEYGYAIANCVSNDTKLTSEQVDEEIVNANAYRTAINAIVNLTGIVAELCGGWLWVSGNTYPHKATLKAAGFMWANIKKMWYFRSPEYATCNRTKMSIDEIRAKYGSQQINIKGYSKALN